MVEAQKSVVKLRYVCGHETLSVTMGNDKLLTIQFENPSF